MLQSLEEMKSSVENHVEQLDTQLGGVNEQLTELEAKLQDKILQVEHTQLEIVEAKKIEEKQYEDMKVRIKYMYEQGNTQYVELFIESESMADFLNKADYITSISKYDRDMLTEYEETRKYHSKDVRFICYRFLESAHKIKCIPNRRRISANWRYVK